MSKTAATCSYCLRARWVAFSVILLIASIQVLPRDASTASRAMFVLGAMAALAFGKAALQGIYSRFIARRSHG